MGKRMKRNQQRMLPNSMISSSKKRSPMRFQKKSPSRILIKSYVFLSISSANALGLTPLDSQPPTPSATAIVESVGDDTKYESSPPLCALRGCGMLYPAEYRCNMIIYAWSCYLNHPTLDIGVRSITKHGFSRC